MNNLETRDCVALSKIIIIISIQHSDICISKYLTDGLKNVKLSKPGETTRGLCNFFLHCSETKNQIMEMKIENFIFKSLYEFIFK